MGKTISFVKGKGSISHNNRDFITKNVDRERMAWNEYYVQQPIKEAYQQIFGPAIAEYNARQKRKDRQVTDYLTDIRNSGNKEKQFYEIVVQIGRMEDTGVLDANGELSVAAKEAREILEEYARNFQERNPNLYLFNAVLHMDEATPHLHLDYIPVAHGYKTKMHTRNSLTKALQEMGIEPAVSKNDTETMHWQQREREYLMEMCREHGLEVEIIGEKRDNYTIPEYKAARQAADELTAELEILNAEKVEVEAVIANVDHNLESSQKEIDEQEELLKGINAQIADAEKKITAKEKILDRIIVAGKPVEKEIEEIKSQVSNVPNFLGGEPMVKLPKKTFEKMISRYRVSGTFENLNKQYVNAIETKDKTIDGLRKQIVSLKNEMKGFTDFLSEYSLIDTFKEFIRPKTLKEKLEISKRKSSKLEQQKKKLTAITDKKHDIAI